MSIFQAKPRKAITYIESGERPIGGDELVGQGGQGGPHCRLLPIHGMQCVKSVCEVLSVHDRDGLPGLQSQQVQGLQHLGSPRVHVLEAPESIANVLSGQQVVVQSREGLVPPGSELGQRGHLPELSAEGPEQQPGLRHLAGHALQAVERVAHCLSSEHTRADARDPCPAAVSKPAGLRVTVQGRQGLGGQGAEDGGRESLHDLADRGVLGGHVLQPEEAIRHVLSVQRDLRRGQVGGEVVQNASHLFTIRTKK